jgi:hypothetical protein
MASKRILKRQINNLTFELISECYIYKHFHPGKKEKVVDGMLETIAQKRNELIQKINNPADKNDPKKNRKFFAEVSEGMKEMVSVMDKLAGK